MKNLIISFILMFFASCRVDRCTMDYYEDIQLYYIVDSVNVGFNSYVKDTFWIEAVHTYSRGKVKTKLKPIQINGK